MTRRGDAGLGADIAAAALNSKRAYLAQLLEAIQRCAYFLDNAMSRLHWPLDAALLSERKKDIALFETLAAVNERFAKLQDTLAAAMKHGALLLAEPDDGFLKVLALFERLGVIASIEDWQRCRAARNLAAHDYDTEYAAIAEHFNALHSLYPGLLRTAARLVALSQQRLQIAPATDDFAAEFGRLQSGT